MIELRVHGRGGQGVVTLCELLAKTAVKTGKQAQTMPFFGVERRGAAVKSSLRIDNCRIKVRSQSFSPDYLALMHANLLPAAIADQPTAADTQHAVFIVNAPGALKSEGAAVGAQWVVDATAIAVRNGLLVAGEPFVNVPMMGAICRVLGLPADKMEETIAEQWRAGDSANTTAAREAYESVQFVERGLTE